MTPSAAYRLKLGLVGAFAVGALAFTGALALALVRPDLRAPGLAALGGGAEARADRLAIARKGQPLPPLMLLRLCVVVSTRQTIRPKKR